MVSSGLPADFSNMKEMIGGCCVCSDERGWAENPLVYCDGHGCNVAVHQACYGIVQVPTGPWFCRKCESQERAARVKCELCPHKDGALKRTDNGGWAHVVCALYIPEVQFANVTTMEPIVLQYVPHERFNKTCYICEEQGRESKAATGACMTCNKHGCRQAFHVTCAQLAGLLCEEEGSEADNVKYCGYCKYHFGKLKQKDRDKYRQQKIKKSLDLSSTVPSLTVTTEKTYTSTSSGFISGSLKRLEETTARFTNANFQEVSTHPSSGNENAEIKGLEAKGKKSGGHGSSQRGRKPATAKNSACPSVTTASPSPFPQGVYTSSDVPVSLQNTLPGSSCSTPLSSSILPPQSTTHSQMSTSPLATVSVATMVSTTQASALPGSSFNLAPSHMFGNRLNPNSAMAALIAQSETNQAVPAYSTLTSVAGAHQKLKAVLEDNMPDLYCGRDHGHRNHELDNNRNLPGRSSSPRGSLSPRSPASGLQIRYDQSSNSVLENLPPVASSIEQLLERHWNEGQQFLLEQGSPGEVMGMLKSLHQLQVENRQLEEQIKNLTAKKERLQLLNAQLSVPFPVMSSNTSPTTQIHPFTVQTVHNATSLHSSKGPHLSNSFLPESTLPMQIQERTSSGHSTSSSSLASPPSTGQSPALQGSGIHQVNCMSGALASGMQTMASTIPTMSSVGGLMGTLPGNQLAINGFVGTLNGVIQTPVSISQNPNPLSHAAVPPNVTVPLSTNLSHSVPGLSLLSEQRQLLFHQQQQPLQQLLPSQQLTPEQHQALFYQIMQQQHHHQHQHELQQLQITGTTQIPMNNLLASAQTQPLHSAPSNPFISIHSETSTPKVARLSDKGSSPVTQEKS
ncbi:protein AF-10 isoform X8 [Carcharodon carcharias]|uniref:protein AF-10 isoform X8 n=1 Tax=Carcharodon carcharias TaxID=13397 RepID=UPI001B7E3C20|nr:protein AF-10 isoform X8 [Carcharodon carcharias]